VRSVLESMGVATASTPDGLGYDVAACSDDRWLRVQVKATAKRSRDGRYMFTTRRRSRGGLTIADCDVVAFVALDLRLVTFRPVGRIRGKTFKLTPSKFLLENERSSWEQAIK